MAIRLTVSAPAPEVSGWIRWNPPVAWEVWNGEAWIATTGYSDSTGGLNRPGEIVLLIPNEHELLTLGSTGAYWLRVRLLKPQPGQPTYQESPRIEDIEVDALGGTVAAEHATLVPGEVLGRSDGSPGQEFLVGRAAGAAAAAERDRAGDRSRRPGGMDRGRGLLPLRPDRHPLRLGFVVGDLPVRSADPLPGRVGAQHGRIPRDGAEIAVDRLPARWRRHRQCRCPHPDPDAVGDPVRLRCDQPARRRRRGGRRKRAGGQGPRSAHPAHRRDVRSPPAISSGSRSSRRSRWPEPGV